MNIQLKEFLDHLKATKEASRIALEGALVVEGAWSTGILDSLDDTSIDDITSELDQLSKEFVDAHRPEGEPSRAVLVKTQIDLLSSIRRDMKLRTMSPVRAAIHQASRERGHAQPSGVIESLIAGQIHFLEQLQSTGE